MATILDRDNIDINLVNSIYSSLKSEEENRTGEHIREDCLHCKLSAALAQTECFQAVGGKSTMLSLMLGQYDLRDLLLLGFELGIRYMESIELNKILKEEEPSGQS